MDSNSPKAGGIWCTVRPCEFEVVSRRVAAWLEFANDVVLHHRDEREAAERAAAAGITRQEVANAFMEWKR